MKFELHLSVSEMNLLIPAIDNYIKFIQESKVSAIKANGKSKIDRLKKTNEKLNLLVSYAKIKTQAEKTLRQAEAKKQRYNNLVFGSAVDQDTTESLLTGDLNKILSID